MSGEGGFVVYFPLDSDILSEGAEAVIDEVAAKAAEQGARSITVYGHTDRNGSLRHNTWLSQRRANQVKDALVFRGLSPESIQIVTMADKELAINQSPGTVEQANRRAVIVFE